MLYNSNTVNWFIIFDEKTRKLTVMDEPIFYKAGQSYQETAAMSFGLLTLKDVTDRPTFYRTKELIETAALSIVRVAVGVSRRTRSRTPWRSAPSPRTRRTFSFPLNGSREKEGDSVR